MESKLRNILAVSAGLIVFAAYLLTLNPGVTFMDSGELGAALYTFGIPHPTGYPLFMIIGYAVSNLPIGSSPIYRLNVLSSVFSSIAVVIFYFALLNILKLPGEHKKRKSKDAGKKSVEHETSEPLLLYAAFFASLVLGLSRTFWSVALSVEVYPLHEVFVCLIILLCAKILAGIAHPQMKYWTYLFLVIGLSFANHMTTLLVIPAILYLVYLQYRASPAVLNKLFVRAFFVIPGLLLYLVLVIRAGTEPFFNWSDPRNLSNLFHHLSGSDFENLIFASGSVFNNNLKLFINTLPGEFAIASFVLGLGGAYKAYRFNKNFFIFLLLIALSSLIYALNYNIRDVQVYFIMFYITYSVFAAFGIIFAAESIAGMLKMKSMKVVLFLGIALAAFGFYYNYSANNNSNDYIVEDISLNTMNSMEENAVYITYDYGYTYPAALYYQQVAGIRRDLKMFNIKFLSVPWYLKNIKKFNPEIYEACKPEIEDYIRKLESDERARVESLNKLVTAFINKAYSIYPVYVSFDLLLNKELKPILSSYAGTPSGIYFRLADKSAPYDSLAGVKSLEFNFRSYKPDTKEKNKVSVSTAGMYYETAYYHYRNGNLSLALKLLDKALSVNKQMPDAVKLKNNILSQKK